MEEENNHCWRFTVCGIRRGNGPELETYKSMTDNALREIGNIMKPCHKYTIYTGEIESVESIYFQTYVVEEN